MNRPITVQDLARACLKEMDKGNANKLVMVNNDAKWGYYHPLFLSFEDNVDVINKNVNTKNPNSIILLG